MKTSLLSICLFFCTFGVHALNVKVINKTLNKQQIVEKISLIRLENQMIIVEQVENVAKTVFHKLPSTSSVPYLVQATYQGITYNQVIPPNQLSNLKSLNVVVFTSTTKYNVEKIQKVSLYSISYVKNKLAIEIYHHFTNQGVKTFFEKDVQNTDYGIYTLVPLNAENLSMSVSVGSGKSNINWLKLNPKLSLSEKDNSFERYLLSYPLKPGLRTYSIYYEIPYDGLSVDFWIASYYPNSQSIKIIKRPDNMVIEDLQTKKVLPLLNSEEFSWKYHEITPISSKLFGIDISGGTPLEEGLSSSQKKAVHYTSIFNLEESLIMSISSTLFCFFVLFVLINKPTIFIKYWNRYLYQYNAKLSYLQKYEKQTSLKKQEGLQKKIEILKNNLLLVSSNTNFPIDDAEHVDNIKI